MNGVTRFDADGLRVWATRERFESIEAAIEVAKSINPDLEARIVTADGEEITIQEAEALHAAL